MLIGAFVFVGVLLCAGSASAMTAEELQPAQTIIYNEATDINSSIQVELPSYFNQGAHFKGVSFLHNTITNPTNKPVTFSDPDGFRVDTSYRFDTQVGGPNDVHFADNVNPYTDLTYSLGTSKKRWKSLYVGGEIYFDGEKIYSEGGNIYAVNNDGVTRTMDGLSKAQDVDASNTPATAGGPSGSGKVDVSYNKATSKYTWEERPLEYNIVNQAWVLDPGNLQKSGSSAGDGQGNNAVANNSNVANGISYAGAWNGQLHEVSGNYAVVMGGYQNEASGLRSFVLQGVSNKANGQDSAVYAGQNNEIDQNSGNSLVASGGDLSIKNASNSVFVSGNSSSIEGEKTLVAHGENLKAGTRQFVWQGGLNSYTAADLTASENDDTFFVADANMTWNPNNLNNASATFEGNAVEPLFFVDAAQDKVGVRANDLQSHLDINDTMRLLPTDAPLACGGSMDGGLYWDDSLNELCDCDGTSWAQVDGGGGC